MVCSLVSFSHLMLSFFRGILFFVRIAFKKLPQPGQSFIARSNCFFPCPPGWSYTASKKNLTKKTFSFKAGANLSSTQQLYLNIWKEEKKRINIFQNNKRKDKWKKTALLFHAYALFTNWKTRFLFPALPPWFNPHGSAPYNQQNQHSKNPTCDLTTF